MFGFGKSTRRVVVAIVYDPAKKGFLLVYNPRWHSYAFPTRRFGNLTFSDAFKEREHCQSVAHLALRQDLGPTLGEASEAHWMDQVEATGVSGRTGRETRYVYDVVTLLPVNPLPAGSFATRLGFLTAQEIRDANPEHPGHVSHLVSWTTWRVLTRLLEDQHVSVAVICRRRAGHREFLMTRNRYARWFFPARRMGDDGVDAEGLAVYEFRLAADYLQRIEAAEQGPPVALEQQTQHLGTRRYHFHLVRTRFPGVNLDQPGNPVEQALGATQWFSEEELLDPPATMSDTIVGLRDRVLEICTPE
jgi:hypothetical protein